MIAAEPNQPVNAYLIDAPPGLLGTLGVTVTTAAGVVVVPRSTAGITYTNATYATSLTAPGTPGTYVILWDANGLSVGEPLQVASVPQAPVPSSNALIDPDLAGYVDAQRRLRAKLGRDVCFYSAATLTWDSAIPSDEFDLEGFPLDPVIQPKTSNAVDVEVPNLQIAGIVRCDVVFQPLSPTVLRSGEFQETEQAIRSRLNIAAIMDISDRPVTAQATHFQIGTTQLNGTWVPDATELWRIIQGQTDGIGGLQRFIVTGESVE